MFGVNIFHGITDSALLAPSHCFSRPVFRGPHYFDSVPLSILGKGSFLISSGAPRFLRCMITRFWVLLHSSLSGTKEIPICFPLAFAHCQFSQLPPRLDRSFPLPDALRELGRTLRTHFMLRPLPSPWQITISSSSPSSEPCFPS